MTVFRILLFVITNAYHLAINRFDVYYWMRTYLSISPASNTGSLTWRSIILICGINLVNNNHFGMISFNDSHNLA